MDAIFDALVAGLQFVGFDHDILVKYLPAFRSGLWITAQIVFWSMLVGALIAYPVAMARLSTRRIPRALAYGYIYFFRGTPLLAQLFLIYYGLGTILPLMRGFFEDTGVWWIMREGFYYVLFAFALNTGAYQAEILRGGIEAVARGQSEAGRALGLHEGQIFRKIVLPQAFLIGLRPLGNELILMIKASSVASFVAVFDFMGVIKQAYSQTYDFQIYALAAIVYLIMVEVIRRLWDRLEWRMTHHLRPAGATRATTPVEPVAVSAH
jgi:polar amino acid transport system permease protein